MNADALVLCAGLGTRLRPLTDELPKPLVPVGDRPLLEHVISALEARGCGRLFVNVHYLPDLFVSHIEYLKDRVEVSREAAILGTAGGIAQIRPRLTQPCLVIWNGDVVTELWLHDLVDEIVISGGLCLAVRRRPPGQGTLGIRADGAIVRLRGERFGAESTGADYLGVAALGAECLATLPAVGCLIGDWALPVLRKGGSIGTVMVEPPYWFDVGEPPSYLRANLNWLARTRGEGLESFIAPGARIATDVLLEQSVVGRDALVEGTGPLRRTIVWPGARVRAPLSDAIVTSAGRVVQLSGG
jgi:mannose-1-phosphate guanylyltransferase